MGISRDLSKLAGAYTSGSVSSFKNRVINGAMAIDQRNAGASVAGSDVYPADRFRTSYNGTGALSIQQVSDAPSGFTRSIKVTVTTADSSLTTNEFYNVRHAVEGYNIADLAWGSTTPSPITLSFWVKSSVTGTFVVRMINATGTYAYATSYTVNTANVWEQKAITVPGPTAGAWDTTNGIGIELTFQFGSGPSYTGATPNTWNTTTAWQNSSFNGTNTLMSTVGATWQATGIQLEKGSTATSFDWRPHGTELALCQRYCYQSTYYGSASFNYTYADFGVYGALVGAGAWMWAFAKFPVEMRATPTVTTSDQAGTTGKLSIWTSNGGTTTNGITPYSVYITKNGYNVSVYNESKYGLFGAIKAEAEL